MDERAKKFRDFHRVEKGLVRFRGKGFSVERADRHRGEAGFLQLQHILFPEGCCDEEGVPEIRFPLNYHWENITDRDVYFADAGQYLERASTIIENRSGKMPIALKEKLSLKTEKILMRSVYYEDSL